MFAYYSQPNCLYGFVQAETQEQIFARLIVSYLVFSYATLLFASEIVMKPEGVFLAPKLKRIVDSLSRCFVCNRVIHLSVDGLAGQPFSGHGPFTLPCDSPEGKKGSPTCGASS